MWHTRRYTTGRHLNKFIDKPIFLWEADVMSDDLSIARRIAEMYREGMATIFPNLTGDISWGFFTREDPRMHLQTVDGELPRPEGRGFLSYWDKSGSFVRVIDLRKEAPGFFRQFPDHLVQDKEISLKSSSISLSVVTRGHHEILDVQLENILWQGSASSGLL